MKYIKKFESFSPLNEGLFGIDISKIKQAVQAVKKEVEDKVIPNMDESKKNEILQKAQQFVKKSGIENPDQLINKVVSGAKENEEELDKVSDEVNAVAESMINEAMGKRAARFFKRLGTYTGLAGVVFGLSSFASHCMGYIDSNVLTKLNEITTSILGANAGPLGFLIMVVGVILAFGSQVWGYNKGV